VQVPTVGTTVQMGMTFSEVESTKSVSDIYAPVSGTVVEVNPQLGETPQALNEDPYGQGWICVIEAEADADQTHLLDAAGYRELVGD
jgi:glycine cleavage system H protein